MIIKREMTPKGWLVTESREDEENAGTESAATDRPVTDGQSSELGAASRQRKLGERTGRAASRQRKLGPNEAGDTGEVPAAGRDAESGGAA